MKVVINKCFGGFGLSRAAVERLRELKCPEALKETLVGEKYKDGGGVREAHLDSYSLWDLERNDPLLVQVVEELGSGANGNYAELAIVDIPDDVEFKVEEYDGLEHVAEVHRTWG